MRIIRFRLALLLLVFSQLAACQGEKPGQGASPSASSRASAPLKAESAVAREHGSRDQRKVAALLPSTRATPQPAELVPTHYLKGEAEYVTRGGLDGDTVEQALSTQEGFDKAAEALSSEAMRSMEAQDLGRYFRRVMERAVAEHMDVVSLSCGLSVCMGSVQTRSAELDPNWSLKYLDDDSFKAYGFIESVERIGDVHVSRFLFSTDPELAAIVVRHPPQSLFFAGKMGTCLNQHEYCHASITRTHLAL